MTNPGSTGSDLSAAEDCDDRTDPSTVAGNGPVDGRAASSSSGSVPEESRRQGKNVGSSVIKVVGGALAAMTAAAIGSGLGVAGTVAGAALVSGCLAVLDSVYTASLHRTRQGVEKVVRTVAPAAQAHLPRRAGTSNQPATPAPTGSTPVATDRDRQDRTASTRETAPTRTKRRRVITGTLLAAGVVFVVTLGGVFGVESVTGHSFNGQKGGTTIGQAARGQNWTQSNRGGNSSNGFQDKDGNLHQPTDNSNRGGQTDKHDNGGGTGGQNGRTDRDGSQNGQNDDGGSQGSQNNGDSQKNNDGGRQNNNDGGGQGGQSRDGGSRNGHNDGSGSQGGQNNNGGGMSGEKEGGGQSGQNGGGN